MVTQKNKLTPEEIKKRDRIYNIQTTLVGLVFVELPKWGGLYLLAKLFFPNKF